MDKKEFDLMVKQMHEQGLDDDKIMKVLYESFITNKCDIEDYETMVNWLGYELNDSFFKDHGLKRQRRK